MHSKNTHNFNLAESVTLYVNNTLFRSKNNLGRNFFNSLSKYFYQYLNVLYSNNRY